MLHVLHTRSSQQPLAPIKAQAFHSTFHAYSAVVAAVRDLPSLGVEEVDSGPFANCLVCAELDSSVTVDGEPAIGLVESPTCGRTPSLSINLPITVPTDPNLPHLSQLAPPPLPLRGCVPRGHAGQPIPEGFRLCCATDCNTKLCHYASCGRTNPDMAPLVSKYFGAVHQANAARHVAGQLNLLSFMSDAAGGDVMDEDDEQQQLCTSQLSCARATAKPAKGSVDRYGLSAAACQHVVPLIGLCSDMFTPEQFVYHLTQLMHVCQQRPDLKDVYIDFACRLVKVRHWAPSSHGCHDGAGAGGSR